MNVLLLGVGYLPFEMAGDKNFFYRLSSLLLKEMKEFVIVSVNDFPEEVIMQKEAEGNIPIYNVRRPFHRDTSRFYIKAYGKTYYHHLHRPIQEAAEKLSTILFSLPYLRHIMEKHRVELIHFMDNFGPAMTLPRAVSPKVKATYSAANYNPRGSAYDFYIRFSLAKLDGIAAYTKAYESRLLEMGIRRDKLRIIRWGVSLPSTTLTASEKAAIKTRLGCDPSGKLALWTGYIQQINESDFYQAVDVATKVMQKTSDLEFVFAFKPESYKDKYALEETRGIKVVTNPRNFGAVLESADVLFSPIGSVRSTVSPPLTWIEAMSRGTPVVTTKIGGADELINDSVTGFIAESYADLADKVVEIVRNYDLHALGNRARDFVATDYNIRDSAREYIRFWGETIG